ncbi:hypothetical protein [Actinomadura madurae]|uniref:hypothetical protein n=1 Tax=Actinomadura madurae TaxID=1993 RepID=UPI0020D204A8|nr:hypothetical protein [Actinomadura madurae]MCQ0005220.1 hypothetical protein [Actinomadura madurae]
MDVLGDGRAPQRRPLRLRGADGTVRAAHGRRGAVRLGEPPGPGGPANAIHADRDAGPAGLLQVLEACGGMLSAMVRTVAPDVRAHHVFGAADGEGFAAMGILETVVHTYDLADGLGLLWEPPADLCARVLGPAVPGGADRHRTLADAALGHGTWRASRPSAPHVVALVREPPPISA